MEVKREGKVAQSCPTLSNPIDCSSSGSSIHGIFQARVLEWGAIAFSDILITHNKNARRLKVKVAQPCPTLRPDGLQPSRLLCSSDSPGKNIGMDSHLLLQGIFKTQESNPGLLHHRQILYRLNHLVPFFSDR